MTCPYPAASVQEDLRDAFKLLEFKLTWLLITMGLPSRSLKLLLPRLLEEPPLSEGPGPSLPDRSARMRIGPLLNPLKQNPNTTEVSFHLLGKEKKQTTDNASCSKRALFFTVYLLCWSSCRHHSSIHALHPWVSGCVSYSASYLWLPWGDHAWAQVASHLCPCGLCPGVLCVEEEVAQLCGLFQSSLGSAQSQSPLCEEQGGSSSRLAHRQTGCV